MPPEGKWSDEHRALIKATVGQTRTGRLSDATIDQMEYISLQRGLDPLLGDLIAYEKGGKPVFITTINGMTKLCAEKLDGIEAVFYSADGDAEPVWLSDKPPAACAVTVYRKGASRPFTNACRFADYKGIGDPWRKMPSTMIRKCALAGALRLAFADLLSGLYVKEEMDQSFNDDSPATAVQQQQATPAKKSSSPRRKSDGASKPAAAAAAAKASDSADDAAEALAQATGGEVIPEPENAAAVKVFLAQAESVGLDENGLEFVARLAGVKSIDQLTTEQLEKYRAALSKEKAPFLNNGQVPPK